MKIDAILWDYDGTLVNSVPKNIDVTRQILETVAPRLTGKNLPNCLRSEQEYQIVNHQAKNWQDLYIHYYGMTRAEMSQAGPLWTEYQLKNSTPVELFQGIRETINQIDLPLGICSQNSSKNINQLLKKNSLTHKFKSIIGYEEIPSNTQKPNAFGGLKCLKEIFGTTADKTIFYIGDHEADVEFAKNIEANLDKTSKVISVAAKYSGANTNLWNYKPDFEISTPIDLIKITNGYSQA